MRNVRIVYKKYGRMKFISHLDVNRLMMRLIRRAKLPIWFTEGFKPHPYITFALPLSLGFESEYDLMDVKITDDSFPPEKIASALSQVAPEGLLFVSSAEPIMKYAEISSADYIVVFQTDSDLFKEMLESFLSKPEINVLKRRKKGNYDTVNIKEKLFNFEVSTTEEGIALKMLIPAGSVENYNPTLYVNGFYEEFSQFSDVKYDIIRGNIYANDKIFK